MTTKTTWTIYVTKMRMEDHWSLEKVIWFIGEISDGALVQKEHPHDVWVRLHMTLLKFHEKCHSIRFHIIHLLQFPSQSLYKQYPLPIKSAKARKLALEYLPGLAKVCTLTSLAISDVSADDDDVFE